jgi:hypothetical protein
MVDDCQNNKSKRISLEPVTCEQLYCGGPGVCLPGAHEPLHIHFNMSTIECGAFRPKPFNEQVSSLELGAKIECDTLADRQHSKATDVQDEDMTRSADFWLGAFPKYHACTVLISTPEPTEASECSAIGHMVSGVTWAGATVELQRCMQFEGSRFGRISGKVHPRVKVSVWTILTLRTIQNKPIALESVHYICCNTLVNRRQLKCSSGCLARARKLNKFQAGCISCVSQTCWRL